MIEILKPDSISAEYYSQVMININSAAFQVVERRDKGLPTDHYIARWDESFAAAPTEAQMLTSQDAVLLEIAKKQKQEELDIAYAAAEDVPVTIGGFTFSASANALAELNSVIIILLDGNPLPPNFSWVDTSGVEHVATENSIKSLQYEVAKKHYIDVHRYAKLTNLVKAATTVAEVEAIPDY